MDARTRRSGGSSQSADMPSEHYPNGEVWPEYNQHGPTLNRFWDQLYEVFPDWQFVLYDPGDVTVLAEGHAIPVAWDGTDAGPGRASTRP